MKYIQLGLVLLAVVILSLIYFKPVQLPVGSTVQGNDYQSTSTNALLTTPKVIKESRGSLGSVIITGVGTGTFDLYNATTSNINLRAASMSTSTIWIASFGPSASVGNYVFDVEFSNGLYLQTVGTVASTTITFR